MTFKGYIKGGELHVRQCPLDASSVDSVSKASSPTQPKRGGGYGCSPPARAGKLSCPTVRWPPGLLSAERKKDITISPTAQGGFSGTRSRHGVKGLQTSDFRHRCPARTREESPGDSFFWFNKQICSRLTPLTIPESRTT